MTDVTVSLDPSARIGAVPRRLFGGFVEHLGRHVYDGIHEPSHPSADEDGFRRDVIELVRELGVSTIRYPGGNFVSGYRWEDGVGPQEERPTRLDLAWHSIETNEVGLHEFSGWLDKVGSDLMLAVNLGTRGIEEAVDLLEYANVPGGTAMSELRRDNGRDEPFAIDMWCLGNEMDGPWQLGHLDADSYGRLASRTAHAMKLMDPSIRTVACGSSSWDMDTFGAWERTVLGHAYDNVDYISCHAYYEERDGDRAAFLASGEHMARFIQEVVIAADHVKALKRSDKTIDISFDEWNVWYMNRPAPGSFDGKAVDEFEFAPRLLEDRYTVLDAVVFGSLLITLLRHCDRVTSASLAQLVNVIAPIMTEPGGPAWRQTTFFPFALTSRLATGQALRVPVTSGTFATSRLGEVADVDAVATWDEEAGTAAVFVVNRALDGSRTVRVDVSALGSTSIAEAHLIADDDLDAANTLEDPERVAPVDLEGAVIEEGVLTLTLPAVSWAAVSLQVG
ncbi:alpha-N-arabinofuranosidase [Demequina sp. NBRC 110056]|uniref:arabinosylfuranosidase ArfA n=1 Tax=Demequina sp. NBRC 110056 TaxID=1570345 RepID=UPI000A02B68A|nr:alpha-N-arabinofuranosidase [Demequina sp. NBRC 110056]